MKRLRDWWGPILIVTAFVLTTFGAMYLNYLKNKARFPDAPNWSNWLK